MKTLIVGGDFGEFPKSSSVLSKISNEFIDSIIINGGQLEELSMKIDSDLIIWMPNISNETKKHYPVKNIGNVLIVSKVMRPGYKDIDAIERIFRMQGNAVIAIYKEDTFRFKLIDALGNTWYDGYDIKFLCDNIKNLYNFIKNSIRCRTSKINIEKPVINSDINELIKINRSLATYIQTSCGERFFGNISTRCSKLFPTMRSNVGVFVSPRNVDKDMITANDMVYCEFFDDVVNYIGNNKPSIDTPVQLRVYENCNQVNFLIHGHAFVMNTIETNEYFLCGDLRESNEVIEIIDKSKFGSINLKKHGFLLYSDTLNNMKNLISALSFTYKRE